MILHLNQIKFMKKQYNIPFIEGDGIGKEISTVTKDVLQSAVDKTYNGNVSLNWIDLFAGESARFKFITKTDAFRNSKT